MQVKTGELLTSRKSGQTNVKVAQVRKDVVMLHNTTSDKRWWTNRDNLSKSYISTR